MYSRVQEGEGKMQKLNFSFWLGLGAPNLSEILIYIIILYNILYIISVSDSKPCTFDFCVVCTSSC